MKLLQQLLEVASKKEAFEVQQQLIDMLPDDYDVTVESEDLGPSISYSVTITKDTKRAFVKWGASKNAYHLVFSMEGVESSTCTSPRAVARVVKLEFEEE